MNKAKSIKSIDTFNKSNISFANKSVKFGTNDKKSFDNIIADVNLDIMRINKKLDKQTDYQEHIQTLMEEEIKLRQEIEKKTFLINENLTSEINKIKQNFFSFSNKIQENLKNNFQNIYDENQINKSKILSTNEEIFKKLNEFEQKTNINKD